MLNIGLGEDTTPIDFEFNRLKVCGHSGQFGKKRLSHNIFHIEPSYFIMLIGLGGNMILLILC